MRRLPNSVHRTHLRDGTKLVPHAIQEVPQVAEGQIPQECPLSFRRTARWDCQQTSQLFPRGTILVLCTTHEVSKRVPPALCKFYHRQFQAFTCFRYNRIRPHVFGRATVPCIPLKRANRGSTKSCFKNIFPSVASNCPKEGKPGIETWYQCRVFLPTSVACSLSGAQPPVSSTTGTPATTGQSWDMTGEARWVTGDWLVFIVPSVSKLMNA